MHHNGSDRYRNRVSWILRTGIQVLVTLATVGVERAQSLYPQTWGSVPNGMPAGLTCVAIKAGEKHVLALKSDGTVVAWGGENSYGQADVPPGLTGVTAIAAGPYDSLALKNDGTIAAWGDNSNGQSTVPSGLGGVVAIAAGVTHSLALRNDGTVVAWGYNGADQTTVPSGLIAIAITAGYNHSVALKSDGTVVAWGLNIYGQTNVPAGLTGVVAIAAGEVHTMALKSDGTVVAWGANFQGQTDVPPGLTGVVAIAAGRFHSLALRSDGTVVAWGQNQYLQSSVPPSLRGVVAIAAGATDSFALTSQAAPPQVTLTANIVSGVDFTVSGEGCQPGSYVTPQSLPWTPGSTCTVSFNPLYTPKSDTRYVFDVWSDGALPGNTRTIIAPSAPASYTADYYVQFLVTTAVVTSGDTGGGAGGTISPATGWHTECPFCSLSVTATANPGFVFTGFSGDLSGVQNPQTISTLRPHSITAHFAPATDLQVVSQVASPAVNVLTGTNVTYTITIRNNGPNAADHVTVTDNLPSQLTLVSCTAAGGVCGGSGNARTVTYASLASGETKSITLAARVNCDVADGTAITNTASISAATPDPTPGNNSPSTSVKAWNDPPFVKPSMGLSALGPFDHNLTNVVLGVSATDTCPGTFTFGVEVFGNEDDETPTSTNEVHSPDARNIAVGTVRLRNERVDSGSGRVYLIVVKATDSQGATGFGTATVVVPKSQSPEGLNAVSTSAAAAKAFADSHNGVPPAGYFVIGDGPVIGPKQ